MAKLELDLDTMTLGVLDLELIDTERMVNKSVRQNSDDLRRSREIIKLFHAFVGDCSLAFAEIPSGAQSARAALSFGISIGLLASCPKPLIQVQPFETKMATVGTKTASKEEMIIWATEKFPDAPWLRAKGGKKQVLNSNEHLADAVAIAHAGIATDQFLQLMAMRRTRAA
jgi:hypothetical protein